jgi:hypothetical protein
MKPDGLVDIAKPTQVDFLVPLAEKGIVRLEDIQIPFGKALVRREFPSQEASKIVLH